MSKYCDTKGFQKKNEKSQTFFIQLINNIFKVNSLIS